VSPPPTATAKSISPAADCSSDSGNQADIDEMHKLLSNNNFHNILTANHHHFDSVI
jgi:hypothetical protein